MIDKETWIKQITDICEMAYEEGYEAGRKSNAITLSTDGTFTAPSQSFLAVAMMAWAHDHEIDKEREYERGYKDGYEQVEWRDLSRRAGEFEAMEHNGRLDTLESEEMTREQAIHVLEFDLDYTFNDESKEALRMGIDALKVEPCNDTISRQAASEKEDSDIVDRTINTLSENKDKDAVDRAMQVLVNHGYVTLDADTIVLNTDKDREPCSDTISRQEAIDAFSMFAEYESNRTNAEWVDRIRVVLSSLPPVQPIRPIGHWINIIDKDLHDYRTGNKLCFECSECRSEYTYKYNYCPNCGARMEEDEDKE